ncbi:hypothetical protein BpHYR1_029438 [Brachionus plicatilis]|uniref:Uncharacterized protein n=1 Tax=Brachionus plicatilis TaxID=10195 RepID=A0A3M7QM07_BRAPC|nr:hypothetical protein BpHYR1_029438 [Brachionus plicatilis]
MKQSETTVVSPSAEVCKICANRFRHNLMESDKQKDLWLFITLKTSIFEYSGIKFLMVQDLFLFKKRKE